MLVVVAPREILAELRSSQQCSLGKGVTKVLSQKIFLKEKRANFSVLPKRKWSILLGFSHLGRDENLYGFSQFCYLRQNPYFSHFFDTRVGGKREKRAYEKIREEVGLPSEEILFLSDVEAELNAAAETEFKTTQIVRAGTTTGERHVISRDFYGVTVEESKA